MRVVTFRRWKLRCDADSTSNRYQILRTRRELSGGCTCPYCENFRRGEPGIYPSEFRELCGTLGIGLGHEVELLAVDRRRSLHKYVGWLPFVGRVASGPPDEHEERINERFFVRILREPMFGADVFRAGSLAEVVFACWMPWTLDIPHDGRHRFTAGSKARAHRKGLD